MASCLACANKGGKLHRLTENEVARQRLKTGMVFQRFNLFPHFTALENITEGPVQVQGRKPAEVKAEAMELLAPGRAFRQGRRTTRRSSPAASSSAWRSPAPLP